MAGKKERGTRPSGGDTVPDRPDRGRTRGGASFPAPPSHVVVPPDYVITLNEIKERIRTERLRVALSANSAMLLMYWEIGRVILVRQAAEGWGAKVIDRLSADLREEFPDMQGLSPRNLKYMRKFAEAWPDRAIVQRAAAQLPWRNNQVLLDKLDKPEHRLWYAERNLEHGWSRDILCLQIESVLHERHGRAVNNFAVTLPPTDSDMAAQLFKDPYLFDFIGTGDPRREREIEQALVDHVQKFLLELGAGFAFVGRQVHLEFASADYYLDLLFYHLKLRCYVVVELKAVPFEPEFVGKLNMYMGAVDNLLRHPDDKLTIGLLLCKGKDRVVAEYALSGFNRPIGVADWKAQLTESLPKELRGSLPTVEEIEAELSEAAEQAEAQRARGKHGGAVRETPTPYGTGGVCVVEQPFDAAGGTDTPFGLRWGGDVVRLTPLHLAALADGKTLALDVQNEYVLFLEAENPATRQPARKTGGRNGR